MDKVPFDKYELEPSPLTQYILERKSPNTCWQVTLILKVPSVWNTLVLLLLWLKINCFNILAQVFMCNSAKYGELGQPFGYLKASTALTCVNLFVMPYNYPVVLPLLGKFNFRLN